jgi:hypothetical protein
MSGGHGHDDHGHGGGGGTKSGGGGVLSGFKAAGTPGAQMTGIFGALFMGLFDDGGGG